MLLAIAGAFFYPSSSKACTGITLKSKDNVTLLHGRSNGEAVT